MSGVLGQRLLVVIAFSLLSACASGSGDLKRATDSVGQHRLILPAAMDRVWSAAIKMLVLEGAYISQCDIEDDRATISFVTWFRERPTARVDLLIRPAVADPSTTEVVASAAPPLAAQAAVERLRGALRLVRYDWLR